MAFARPSARAWIARGAGPHRSRTDASASWITAQQASFGLVVQDVIDRIGALPNCAFRALGLANALTNQHKTLLAEIDARDYCGAKGLPVAECAEK